MNKKDYGISDHYLGEKGKRYFEWQNKGDSEIGIINSRIFSTFINENDVVADFGCGGGHLLAALKCKRKIGVEINPHARKRAERYGFPVFNNIYQIEDNSIDNFISNHALEHVSCPIDILKQIRRCLVKNGRIVICVPIDDWRNQKKFRTGDINHHLYTWTPQLIGNSLIEAGFEIESIKVFNHAWLSQFLILNKFLPIFLFDFLCYLTSILLNTRHIVAVGVNK